MIIRLPMSPKKKKKNLTHEHEIILFTLKTTTSNPLDFERERVDLGNEILNKRNIRSKSWSSGHLCGLTLMRCLNSQPILFSSDNL